MKEEYTDIPFNDLKVGDIIWAKRYKTEKDRKKLKSGHRESPFVIIKKTKTKLYGLMSTSNPHNKLKWKKTYYMLGRLTYNLNKNCYISTTNCYEIKEKQYVGKINSLTPLDLNKLKKYLYIIMHSNNYIIPYIKNKDIKCDLDMGDIIRFKGLRYYIHSEDKKNYYTYKIGNKTNFKTSILMNNTYYNIVYNNSITIQKNNKIELLDTSDDNKNDEIDKIIYNSKNKEKVLTVGSLIYYKDKYYYIYEINDNVCIGLVIYLNTEHKKNMIGIKINEGHYYTYFENNKLNYSSKYKIKRVATNDEQEYIKKIFLMKKKDRLKNKNMFKLRKNDARTINDFIPRVIIYDKKNEKNYLIIERKNNVVELVNINDLSDSFYFILDENSCPYEYYDYINENEYKMYIDKINEIKKIVEKF